MRVCVPVYASCLGACLSACFYAFLSACLCAFPCACLCACLCACVRASQYDHCYGTDHRYMNGSTSLKSMLDALTRDIDTEGMDVLCGSKAYGNLVRPRTQEVACMCVCVGVLCVGVLCVGVCECGCVCRRT